MKCRHHVKIGVGVEFRKTNPAACSLLPCTQGFFTRFLHHELFVKTRDETPRTSVWEARLHSQDYKLLDAWVFL